MSALYPQNLSLGVPTFLTPANPGVGVQPTIMTVPVGRIRRIRSVHARLTTSAVAGARQPELEWIGGGGLMASAPQVTTLAAAGTRAFVWALGLNDPGTAVFAAHSAMPDTFLFEGHTLLIWTPALDPGDQWTGIRIVYEDFLLTP